MAYLFITEYDRLGNDTRSDVEVGREPAIATQRIAISGSSAQSAAFNANTKFVRLHTDAICSISFGANPTATTSTPRMAADTTEYFGVTGGHKVAVITNT